MTITMGGNDADFSGKVITCLVGACGEKLMNVDPSSLDDPELTSETLEERLAERYVDIRRAMADDGTLFVLSYPIPFRIETGIAPCAGFELPEMQGANALSTRLGDTIEDAVDAASEQLIDDGDAANLVFVDWRTGDRVDDGYTTPTGEELDYIDSENGICSGEPYMNGFDRATLFSGDLSNNFHPCRRRLRVRAARRGDGGPARRLRRAHPGPVA